MAKVKKTRIAAVGDLHVKVNDHGKWKAFFQDVSENADLLLIAGDLTDLGKIEEAKVLKEELHACRIPVVAVLGNHDYESNQQEEIKVILNDENFTILDGTSVILDNVGIAGTKGFGGGFDAKMLSMFGEPMIKHFVQEAVTEALHLDTALTRLEKHENLKKFVLLHYAPVIDTVIGEPEQILPFLGCSRLSDPINRRNIEAVFHGHAHIGTFEGKTISGAKVFNVSYPILKKQGKECPYYIYEV